MTTILEDRYGRGWLAFRCDPEDIPEGLNGGDAEHFQFWRKAHSYPIGWGRTPNDARDALDRETARYQQDTDGYRCCLDDQRAEVESCPEVNDGGGR